jgi:hypothetical protein
LPLLLVATVLFLWVIAPPTPDERTLLHDSMGASTGIAWGCTGRRRSATARATRRGGDESRRGRTGPGRADGLTTIVLCRPLALTAKGLSGRLEAAPSGSPVASTSRRRSVRPANVPLPTLGARRDSRPGGRPLCRARRRAPHTRRRPPRPLVYLEERATREGAAHPLSEFVVVTLRRALWRHGPTSGAVASPAGPRRASLARWISTPMRARMDRSWSRSTKRASPSSLRWRFSARSPSIRLLS